MQTLTPLEADIIAAFREAMARFKDDHQPEHFRIRIDVKPDAVYGRITPRLWRMRRRATDRGAGPSEVKSNA